MLAIHASTGSEMMKELIDVIRQELSGIASHAAPEREVARARAQLKAGLLMGLESCSVRAEQMARQLLVAGRLIPQDEIIARIDDVTPEKMRSLAASVLADAPLSIAVVGAGKKSRRLAEAGAGLGNWPGASAIAV